ncbi:hypothetical protein CTAYLR_007134 [Chrysophaeum taylorii]|uniref:serine O-acetyltransferase n=1 Tax=Chrysophaeum taylorii TaxID=2483200 RepID=A0AAD7U7B2_9STRA|nr:hypothetical protein CTAYLR_007134 [Chrysophaeum taylorii]
MYCVSELELFEAAVVVGVVVGCFAVQIALVERRKRRKQAAAMKADPMFEAAMHEAKAATARQPLLSKFFGGILEATSFEEAVAACLANRFAGKGVSRTDLFAACRRALSDPYFSEHGWPAGTCIRRDCLAVMERDPACDAHVDVLLYFKGYAAIQAHRVARWAWDHDDKHLALWLQSRVSEVAGIDIHPAAEISCGVMFDHGTGVVIGETAVVGDGCTLLHGVTLGATGKDRGDRHPKIGKYVLIGAGASILGNIHVGDGAKVGSGAVVLRHVPSGATAVGAPAKIVGRAKEARPAEESDNGLVNVIPQRGNDDDVACVWREISKHAKPQARAIGVSAFSKALAEHGVPLKDIGELFFQLDADNDGLVSENDLKEHFPQKAQQYCAGCACPRKRALLADAICTAICKNSASPTWKSCTKDLAQPPKPAMLVPPVA